MNKLTLKGPEMDKAWSERQADVPQQRPPLGIMPERIWKEKRLQELLSAMDRYEQAGKEVPVEWLIEYRNLSTELWR